MAPRRHSQAQRETVSVQTNIWANHRIEYFYLYAGSGIDSRQDEVGCRLLIHTTGCNQRISGKDACSALMYLFPPTGPHGNTFMKSAPALRCVISVLLTESGLIHGRCKQMIETRPLCVLTFRAKRVPIVEDEPRDGSVSSLCSSCDPETHHVTFARPTFGSSRSVRNT